MSLYLFYADCLRLSHNLARPRQIVALLDEGCKGAVQEVPREQTLPWKILDSSALPDLAASIHQADFVMPDAVGSRAVVPDASFVQHALGPFDAEGPEFDLDDEHRYAASLVVQPKPPGCRSLSAAIRRQYW